LFLFTGGDRVLHFHRGNDKNPKDPARRGEAIAKTGKSCLPCLPNLPNLPNEISVALISSGLNLFCTYFIGA
jgi:hypothetical protein